VALSAAEWHERAGDNTAALRLAEHAAMLGERGAREMADRLKSLR
jgi:hypothetical protein